MESDLVWLNNKLNQVNADWSKSWIAYVDWNYNAQVAKVVSWWVTYLLALPSIITSDVSDVDLINIINNNNLVYRWQANLPSSYTWTTFNLNWAPDLSLVNVIEVYSWSTLPSTWTWVLEFLTNLQEAYTWTDLTDTLDFRNIRELDLTSSDSVWELWWNILNIILWQTVDVDTLKVELTSSASAWTSVSSVLTIWTDTSTFVVSTVWTYDIYVSKSWDDTGWDWSQGNPYKTIWKAITMSSQSWSIYVWGWVYEEFLSIYITWLELIWEDPETTTITTSSSASLISLNAPWVTIRNLNLTSTNTASYNVINVWGSGDWAKIITNKISWWLYWIYEVWNWYNLSIINNTIYWATFDWIRLDNSYSIGKLINNIIVNNGGVWIRLDLGTWPVLNKWYNLVYGNVGGDFYNYTAWTWDLIWVDPWFGSWTYQLASWSLAIDAWIWTMVDYWIDSTLGATWSLDTWVIDLWYHWAY